MFTLKTLALWTLAFSFATSLGFAAPAEEVTPLTSTVFDWNTRVERPTEVGIYRGVTDLPTATLERFECHITTLNVGNESHPPHQHPQEEFIILQEGELDVYINGEIKRVGPGALFFFSSYDWHSVNNVGDGPATYLVFNYASKKTSQIPKQPAAEWAPETAQPSDVFPWPWKDGDPEYPYEFFNAPTVTVENLKGSITSIEPNASTDATRNPADSLVVVKDGQLKATINGESSVVGRGSIIFISSNDEHMLSNPGDTEAVYYTFSMATTKTPAM